MGNCFECKYFHGNGKTGKSEEYEYCTYLDTSVNGGAKCKYYEQRPTKENSRYKEERGLIAACFKHCANDGNGAKIKALTSFRDGYMQKDEKRREQAEYYYKIAPVIAERIELSDKKEKCYEYVKEVAEKCVNLIKINECERVLQEFKFMIDNLKKEFCLM